jgi:hypothetical protein
MSRFRLARYVRAPSGYMLDEWARPINWHAQFSFFGGLVDPRGSGENRRLRDDQWHPAPFSHAAGFIVPIRIV